MGLSGIILKRKEDVDIYKTMKDVQCAAVSSGLEVIIDTDLYEYCGEIFTTANIANKFDDTENSMQFLMYLYAATKKDYLDEFDWILKRGHLIQSINIENFHDCERVLLDFLYEYMRLNPNDIFWDEMEWFYKYDDIVKIHNQRFDKDWCYKKP